MCAENGHENLIDTNEEIRVFSFDVSPSFLNTGSKHDSPNEEFSVVSLNLPSLGGDKKLET